MRGEGREGVLSRPARKDIRAPSFHTRNTRHPGPELAQRAPPPPGGREFASPREVHLVAPYGAKERIDAYLTRYVGQHSRSEWQRLIESGIVTLNGARARPSTRLAPGDRLEIRPVAPFALLQPDPSIMLDVVYEDPALIVINKPAGLVVHPAPGHQVGTLVHGLLARFPDLQDPSGLQRPGIIHRLDKDTSGLMVVGKTTEAMAAVQRAMQRGEVLKRYRLLVLGNLEEDRAIVEVPVGRDSAHRQRMAATPTGRPARTEFTVLERFGDYTLVEATLGSGRTHQLRVHFAYIRHPVAGDRTYGSRPGPASLTHQFVHACELGLVSPATGERLHFTATLPANLEGVLGSLRGSAAGGQTPLAGEVDAAAARVRGEGAAPGSSSRAAG